MLTIARKLYAWFMFAVVALGMGLALAFVTLVTNLYQKIGEPVFWVYVAVAALLYAATIDFAARGAAALTTSD